jgi:glycosyltransferase involved in cell wall biosynthesis
MQVGPQGGEARTAAPSRDAARRRVLFLESSIGGGVIGGSLTGILELLPHLDADRWQACLVVAEPKPSLDLAGVPVHVLTPRRGSGGVDRGPLPVRVLRRASEVFGIVMPRARELLPLFERERPDVVYLASGLTSNLAGAIAAARSGVPVVCHFKGFRRVGPIDRWCSRWIDTAITMTDEIGAHYRGRGIRARRFVTIYDGVDVARFATGGGASVRRELGVPAEAPCIGIVGHVQGWKGQLLVAEAVARARRRIPDLYCLIVGGVHRLGAEYAERLKERVAAPDLAGHVMLGGARRDVAACMDAMDVVVHASDREPFGRVLLEAMAATRPVIAPREGGPLEIVTDGETGVLVPPRDADALANAIVSLFEDPGRRTAMARAARAHVAARFDIRQHAQAVEAVLEDVLRRRPAGSAA